MVKTWLKHKLAEIAIEHLFSGLIRSFKSVDKQIAMGVTFNKLVTRKLYGISYIDSNNKMYKEIEYLNGKISYVVSENSHYVLIEFMDSIEYVSDGVNKVMLDREEMALELNTGDKLIPTKVRSEVVVQDHIIEII